MANSIQSPEFEPEKKKKKGKGKHKHPAPTPTPAPNPSPAPTPAPLSGDPIFAQPAPSPDPTAFKDPIADASFTDTAGVQPVPMPAGGVVEPVLTLTEVFGSQGAAIALNIQSSGQIVFHSVGDTGSVVGPATQSLVADKMLSDFTEANPADVPSFYYHLGDVVYYFGESEYYYDQFFEPYRSYPAPILGIPGNHDGIVYPTDPESSLVGYLTNFCATVTAPSPDAGGLSRTTMIQPGVYYTFDAPFVRILGLYSNVLEDPGVISDQSGTYSTLDQRQLAFLTAALQRIKTESYAGAVIVAVHHPPFTGGVEHGGSPLMLTDIDNCCTAAGVWPHAVLSGHSHNYQRYTRTVNGYQIPYVVAGCGGHSPLSAMRSTIRTPYVIDDTLTLESYDDTDYGYLRIVVNASTMTIEFHPESDGGTTKTPDDSVIIDLAARTVG